MLLNLFLSKIEGLGIKKVEITYKSLKRPHLIISIHRTLIKFYGMRHHRLLDSFCSLSRGGAEQRLRAWTGPIAESRESTPIEIAGSSRRPKSATSYLYYLVPFRS